MDQQVVEVLPLPTNRVLDRFWCVDMRVDDKTPNGFGFHGSERRGDPLDACLCVNKRQVFEIWGL